MRSDVLSVRANAARTFAGSAVACAVVFMVLPHVAHADADVSAVGTQVSTLTASTSDNYLGGTFVVSTASSSETLSTITLSEAGSVSADTELDTVALKYEFDTTAPYDCSSVSYDGTEAAVGATTTFSTADGSVSFSDSIPFSDTSAVCLYPVLDVASGADSGDTIELEIADPSNDVVLASGNPVTPSSSVTLSGTTEVTGDALSLDHFHWRNDDGGESAATSRTDGVEDTPVQNVLKNTTIRLRMAVSNQGTAALTTDGFQLQYAPKTTSCSVSTGWRDVTNGSDWRLSASEYLTDGADTSNIAEGIGGVSDASGTFISPNGGIRDETELTDSITLDPNDFSEIEYAIEPTDSATHDQTYCFRMLNGTSSLDTYSTYGEATIRRDNDFYVQRGDATISGTSTMLEAGIDYDAPAEARHAFIRLTNTQHTGAGNDSGGGPQDADEVTAYIENASNITESVTISRPVDAQNTRVTWEIIEYIGPDGGDNEIIVRQQDAATFGPADTALSASVSNVQDGNDLVPYITGTGHPDSGRDDYHTMRATAQWDDANGKIDFTRGVAGNDATTVSFAAVEFVGDNWTVQRAEHRYSSNVSIEDETISPVGSLSRAFLHVQKRIEGEHNTIDNFGHEVWLSDPGIVSFKLAGTADSPEDHVSVAYVIENTQTTGDVMEVTRSNGTQSGGSEPSIVSVPIGTQLDDTTVASVITNNRVSGLDTSYPRPMMGVRLASSTAYELFISDTGQTRTYRTAVVEWPTAARTISQNYYRFYTNNNALDPTDPWPTGASDLGENTSITASDDPPTTGDVLRIRMSLLVDGANLGAQSKQFKLQYGKRQSTCSAISNWQDIGNTGSSTAVWRGYNASSSDGTALSGDPPSAGDLNLSVSDRAGTYEEENLSAPNPYKISMGEDVEYDWVVQENGAAEQSTYCFRMVQSDGSVLDTYSYYPTVTTAGYEPQSRNWRWYDDESNLTPTNSLAGENVAPANIAFSNPAKLRITVEEIAGKSQENAKFKLQYSKTSDFSENVHDVVDAGFCSIGESNWCYADGAGAEQDQIASSTLSDADTCSGGSGPGCGTRNEFSFVASTTIGEVGTTTLDATPKQIELNNSYDDPVIVVSPTEGVGSGPATNRPAQAEILATTSQSVTIRIAEPDNEADDHGIETVSYIVMEAGTYTLEDGTRIEADTLTTSSYIGNSVTGTGTDTCSFNQAFSARPTLLAGLQTDNNTGAPDFLSAAVESVTTGGFTCALGVPAGESDAPAQAETIGWIAVGQGTTNSGGGLTIEAGATGNTAVNGWSNFPWHEEPFSTSFSQKPVVIASKRTRNEADGGWVRYDNLTPNTVQLAIDQADDGDRSNATGEGVDYLALSQPGDIVLRGTPTFTMPADAAAEFEFTLEHAGADDNTVYYFRLFDVTNGQPVQTGSGDTYPSVSTEGAQLSFSINGVASSTDTEGITTDIDTTANSVPFGSLPIGSSTEAAQRLSVTTNAPGGYQVFAYGRQGLISSRGTEIDPIAGTNQNPVSWDGTCTSTVDGCFGYHAGDDVLSGGSTRFAAEDSYAAFSQEAREVIYSADPTANETHDMVYRVQVRRGQPAGQYESSLVYIVVPVF
jgi:hypothetical protein